MTEHLLVVDDDEDLRVLLRHILQSGGYRVTTASGGGEALKALSAEPFSLVLLDLAMGDMNGLEVLQRIRQNQPARELPVLIISASGGDPKVVEALDLGANDFLSKPVGAPVLLAKVRRHLTLRSAEAARESILNPDELVLEPGRRFGQYELLSLLGEGSRGQIFRARDVRLERQVALKTRRESSGAALFDAEARLLSRLAHPNTVLMYDTGSTPLPFLAVELVEGVPLNDPGLGLPLEGPQACLLCIEILEVLRTLHAQNLIHTDLRPENIFVTPSWHIKILDFSRVKSVAEVEQSGSATATSRKSQYSAPEQVLDDVFGPLTPRTDLYCAAGLLYLLLTGSSPFPAATASEYFFSIATKAPTPLGAKNPSVSDLLASICLKGLSKQPATRYQTADEFSEALYTQI